MDSGALTLGVLLLVFLILSVASFVYVDIQTSHDKEYIRLAGELRVLSQNIVAHAAESANANVATFVSLDKARNQFALNLRLLQEGNPNIGLPLSSKSMLTPLNAVDGLWQSFGNHVQTVLDEEQTIHSLNEIIDTINNTIPELLSQSDEVVSIMIEAGMSAKQIYVASRQLMLIPRMSVNANEILHQGKNHDSNSNDAALNLQKDVAHFGRILNSMQNGNPSMGIEKVADPNAREKLDGVSGLYNSINDMVALILEQTPALFRAHLAAHEIIETGSVLLEQGSALMQAYSDQSEMRMINGLVTNAFGAITLCIFILLSFRIQRSTKKNLIKTEQQNRRNQNAIGRLLDEISTLADGDLTVHATITEDITGAIADAINYTTDQLRHLVSSINQTTEQISAAAQSTQATAMHLAEASDQQAEQISTVTAAVKEMAASIVTVSNTANRSSEVATQSVDIAKKGALAVQNSIRGMDTIREQIQSTSKRIKRLGESSQEISDMVDLINDIAEQTNILALNAAIQASMAGESGHGFAIVADEVQHLAEKSTDATRKIETLISTILADTHEAVDSMEHSTLQVVAGTKIAQNSGEALTEIENVSALLAELTQSISASAQQQTTAAANISESMTVIEKVTSQNLSGTNKTSASIGHLADLSTELRKSVAGFKLPEQSH